MGGIRIPTYEQTRCFFQRPPLMRYRQVMANYADQWAAADKAKRVDHLRHAWRKSDPRSAIAAALA